MKFVVAALLSTSVGAFAPVPSTKATAIAAISSFPSTSSLFSIKFMEECKSKIMVLGLFDLLSKHLFSSIWSFAGHQWVKVDGDIATIGISDHLQDAMGEITFVRIPEMDMKVEQHEELGHVVSEARSGNCYVTPVTGTIVRVNQDVNVYPKLLNLDAEGEGWIVKIKMSNPSELDGCEWLVDKEAYEKYVDANPYLPEFM